MITIETQITFKEFLQFNLKRSLFRIILFTALILVIFVLNFYNAENDTKEIFKSALIWFFVVFLFIIVRSYFSVKNAFFSNRKFQEKIIYTFNNEKVLTKGETFEADFTWVTLYKIKETKDWLLLYQSVQTMNMVPKKDFTKQQIAELRKIIKESGAKAKLRND